MPSIMVNIQIELVTCLRDFVPEEDFVLSLRTQFRFLFKLLFQLEDFVLGRILSQGGFYSKEFYPISSREDFWLEDMLTAKKIWTKRKIVLGKISFSGKILDYWNIFSIGVLKVKGVFCDKGWLCPNVDIFLEVEFEPWKNCLWGEILHQRKNLKQWRKFFHIRFHPNEKFIASKIFPSFMVLPLWGMMSNKI